MPEGKKIHKIVSNHNLEKYNVVKNVFVCEPTADEATKSKADEPDQR